MGEALLGRLLLAALDVLGGVKGVNEGTRGVLSGNDGVGKVASGPWTARRVLSEEEDDPRDENEDEGGEDESKAPCYSGSVNLEESGE